MSLTLLLLSAGYKPSVSVSVTDIVILAGVAVLGLLALRYRTGGFWRQTAEERGARIDELEKAHARDVDKLSGRIAELEKKNHEQAVKIAQLEARPNMEGLYELLAAHDQRTQEAFALFKQETADITSVLHGMQVALGEIARTLTAE